MKKRSIILATFTLALAIICQCRVLAASIDPTTPLKLSDIERLSSGDFLVTSRGVNRLMQYDSEFSKLLNTWSFDQYPTGVAVSDTHYYVTTFESNGELYKIDAKSGEIVGSIELESGAIAPVITADQKSLYVSNQFQGTVSKIDLESFTKVASVKVLREPKESVISADGSLLFVNNFLPMQRADVDVVCSAVTVIDLTTFKPIKDIRLANGSNALRGVALSPDGKFVMVSHNLGRFQVPTNQLQQGWMNTSAVSIIDVASLEFLGAVLLDEPEQGAAGIDHIECSETKMVVAHSGTHEVSIIDYEPFIEKFLAAPDKMALNYDLKFMYGLRKRVAIKGNGSRYLYVDGDKAYVPTYFSDDLNVVDLNTDKLISTTQLQPERIEDDIFKGEMYFNDATYCFQNWQSCNGCHPGDGRTDGMNWDLMNDGVGNAKNCKSMLYSHVTPPAMISGIRAMAEIAVRKGFTHIQFAEIPEANALCVDEYLKSLRPVPSPYLVGGELSESAERGKKVYQKYECGSCHSGQYYTDMKMYRIGDDVEFENGWDTPTLIEVWRTAPYLFDGRAATLDEVFSIHKHGIEGKISKKDVIDLTEYVNSL
ncbi:MAG: YVTN family beta-propeller repeat-containing protein [Rikenellaceae bacterium]